MSVFLSGWGLVLAALGFGFVIFIHELGHFLFAKWAGVRVERFSIGFGPVLWSRRLGETEYTLSLLPLGGYVRMTGEEGSGVEAVQGASTAPADARSFLHASAGWRALILLGGVLFNLISSYIILLCLAWYGMPMKPPVVGDINPAVLSEGVVVPSPAKLLGLHHGDRILALNDRQVISFDEVFMAVAGIGNEPVRVTVRRPGVDHDLVLPSDPGLVVRPVHDDLRGIPTLGIEAPRGDRIGLSRNIGVAPVPGMPEAGEQVVAVGGQRLPEGIVGQQIDAMLAPSIGEEVTLGLRRGADAASEREVTILYAGDRASREPAYGLPARIGDLKHDSPAYAAGLRPGDVVLEVAGTPISGAIHFMGVVRPLADSGQPFAMRVKRGGEQLQVEVTARPDHDGRMRVGIPPETVVTGRVPWLPPALGGAPNALGAAGIEAGQTIVQLEEKENSLQVAVLGGGETLLIPVPRSTGGREALALPAKLLKGLLGTRVVTVDQVSGGLALEDIDGVGRTVGLGKLEPAMRQALFTGLQPGDWICGTLSITGAGVPALEVLRGAPAQPRRVVVTPTGRGVALMFEIAEPPHRLGSWTEAFPLAARISSNMVTDTLRLIPRFFKKKSEGGIAATKSLAGPIGIFSALKASSERLGFASYLKLVALIGLNLFLVNLLPIPVVDGGQLVFLGIETVMRRPLPDVVKLGFNYLGLVLIISLFIFVIGIDVTRLFGGL